MLLRVLGTAAGGGLPQWNCACPGCTGARLRPHRRRRHASLAVRTADGRWYLVNATPDLGDQIEENPDLHPGPGVRQTPLAGVVLTDAELDHTLGVARLREARDGFEVLATAPVRDAVRDRLGLGAVLDPYTRLNWRELTAEPRPLEPSPLMKGGSWKGAAGAEDVDEAATDTWSIALRLHDPATRRTLLYAPALAVWSDALDTAAREADCLIVDGTFWDDDEPRRAGFSERTATAMGHLPIAGPNGTARRLTRLRARCLYTHLNNTNPLVDPHAEQHKLLAERGLEVASDRMVIDL